MHNPQHGFLHGTAPNRGRFAEHRAAKTQANKAVSEDKARTALILGGGAPNMPLMAGAVAAFHDKGVTFDVVSSSGAGSLAGLLWLAPKGRSAAEALRSVRAMSVSDAIYQYFPVNYKVFSKLGPFADLWRNALNANPLLKIDQVRYEADEAYAFVSDWMLLWAAMLTPGLPQVEHWGLCAPTPFIEHIIDFASIKDIKPHFYLNAYNATQERIDDFAKQEITIEHFHAALAFPFIYGPYSLNGDLYYEGAVVDCLNFKDVTEKHLGLETIVVLDVLGSKNLIRAPRNLYDSWVLSMIIPLVATAEDDLELFALKHNKGWRRAEGAKADLLKVEFDIAPEHRAEVLDWSASNARRLFDIGYGAGLQFAERNMDALARTGTV